MKIIEKNPIIMIIIGVIGISLSSIFVRYSAAPSVVTAAFRLLWTVLFLTPVAVGRREVRKEFLKLPKKTFWLSAVSGIFLAIHFALWFESLKKTSVASSTSIVCTEVVWVAIGYCLFLKGKLNFKAVMAIVISLVGSLIIAYSDSQTGASVNGAVLALLSAIAVAIYVLLGRVVRNDTSTTVYTYIVYVSCSIVLVMMCVIGNHNLFVYGISAVIVGLLLALFSTILGHSIFSWCLKYFSPAFVSASKLCEPVVAAILAGILFFEIPTALQIIGGILIIGGVLFYSKQEVNQ